MERYRPKSNLYRVIRNKFYTWQIPEPDIAKADSNQNLKDQWNLR